MDDRLVDAINRKDNAQLEYALAAVSSEGLALDLIPILIDLLGATWHRRHEDVASFLQQVKPVDAVPALKAAALQSYPQYYDDGLALIRKCTWTLADIGTPEARSALQQISQVDDSTIASFATKRLVEWDSELHRKGNAN